MTSLTTLITELDQDLTRDTNHRLWSSSTKARALNDAQVQLTIDLWIELEECRDAESITSVAWTMEYSLPSDFLRAVVVRYNWEPLARTTKPALKTRYRTFNTSWIPACYYVYWSYLWVYPLPSASWVTIDLEYLKKLPALSDSQWTVVPDTHNRALKFYAAYLLWLPMKTSEADKNLEAYEQQLDKLRMWYVYNDEQLQFGYQRHSSAPSEKAL